MIAIALQSTFRGGGAGDRQAAAAGADENGLRTRGRTKWTVLVQCGYDHVWRWRVEWGKSSRGPESRGRRPV